jgi:signal transduction histidine kinase
MENLIQMPDLSPTFRRFGSANACQAAALSTHGPEVTVLLTEVDERIYVTISDNGPGIPASVRRTLFDPFVTAGKPNGTGLGSPWLIE